MKKTKQTELVLDGNHASAEALRQINPEVFGFYPITPTSYIGEEFSKFVANGEVETEYVCAESEHAALSVCVGASAAGVRACSATASQGLLLMTEVIWNASGMRLPIVLINGNRSIGAPLSIHCDHTDAMSVRDAGWIQLYAENAQEVYDFLLCAYRIAEDKKVRTPIMICMDCFQTTHTKMNVLIESDQAVQKFVGEPIVINSLLDIENPVSYGTFDKPDFYMEHRRSQLEGLLNAEKKISEVFQEFSETFGRGSKNLLDEYQTEDAKTVVITMASTAGTIRRSVDLLRKKGIKAGMVRLKVFRPLPQKALIKSLSRFKKILVLDRMSPSGANFGAVGSEISSLFNDLEKKPQIKNVIYGLGSRETSFEDFADVIEDFENLPQVPKWINLRD